MRRFAALSTALFVSVLAATPVAAAPGSSTTTTTTPATSSSSTSSSSTSSSDNSSSGVSSPLSSQYDSLAAALLVFNADAKGVDLATYLSNPGASQLVLPAGGLTFDGVSSLGDLSSTLNAQGATLDPAQMTSFEALYKEFAAKAGTLDGSVALNAASFATALSSLRVPDLASPGAIDSAALASMPVEGLAFGLFVDKSLTALIASHPDVFAQVQSSGLNSPAAVAAFKQSMLAAGVQVGSDMSRLPMPCLADMMQAMGTGQASSHSSGCSSCASAGAYLHQGAFAMLDPNTNVAGQGPGGSPSLSSMQPWLSDALSGQNQSLNQQLNSVVNPTSVASACTAGAAGASAAIGTTLPGVFGNLGKPVAVPSLPNGSPLPGVFGNLTGPTPTVSVPVVVGAGGAKPPTNNGVSLPGVFGNLQGPR